MKSSEQIVAYIARRIGYMYYHPRPISYGGTGEGVGQLLLTYHEIWSEIVERQREFKKAWSKAHEEEGCNTASFATRYAMSHPDATEDDVVVYVLDQWRKLSDRIGVPIPHAELKAEFDRDLPAS